MNVSDRRLHQLGLLAALACAALAALPLLATPGLVNTRAGGDSPFLLLRVYELQANISAGIWPARWMPNAAFGLGYPFFHYYGALPYYLAALLSLAGAGVLWAIKLTQLCGFLAAAVAFYALAADLLGDPLAAFLGAAAYTFAPFHLVNVYVRGDSLSEFYAFVFYPLILWAIMRLRRAPSPGHMALLAFSYAGLLLCHNISAYIFTPLAGLALLAAGASAPRQPIKVLLAGSAALLLGAAMSAWFWAPALRDRGLVSLQVMTTGYFSYDAHFRGADLVQKSLLFDYSIDSQHNPFVLGGLQATLAAMGMATALASWVWQRRPRWADLALLPLLAYALWPITRSSLPLWQRTPLLPMAQFPWRFLSIAALALATATAVGLTRLGRLRWLAVPLAALLAMAALARLQPESLPLREADITAERLQLYEQFSGNIGSTVRGEYLPTSTRPMPRTSAALLSGTSRPAPLAISGALAGAQMVDAGPTHQNWEVTVATAPARLLFHTYAFPWWRVHVDGRPVALVDPAVANGRMVIDIAEPGRHFISLNLEGTPSTHAAERLALSGLILGTLLAALGLWHARAQWRRGLLAAAVLALLALAARLPGVFASAGSHSTPSPWATETMDYPLLPYLHPNPQGVAYGEGVRLLGYELASEAHMGQTLFVRLHWQVDNPEGLQAVVRLTTAAETVETAPSWGISTVPMGATTEHALVIPPEAAPGLVLLAVEVRGPAGTVAPHTPRGTLLGTQYLAPVRVAAPARDPEREAINSVGPWVDVLAARVQQIEPGLLLVRPTWRANRQLPADYKASVKLLDVTGAPVPDAARDTQPRQGLLPTSLWPVGVPVADYYLLAIPAGTPPGAGYQAEIILYEEHNLAALGSFRMAGIAIEHPTVQEQIKQLYEFGALGLTVWRPHRLEIEDGEQVVVDVQWTARDAPLPDCVARLSLVHAADERAVTQDERTVVPAYPLSLWPQYALVNDQLLLHVPPGTAPGNYHLRLEVITANGDSWGLMNDSAIVRVHPATRNRALPPISHPLGMDFGDLIRLAGYDLERTSERLDLTCHWLALQAPGHDYRVFVHLYDPSTESIVAQRDAMPLADTYPTSRWAKGEVVSDRIVLDMGQVPPGRYQLAVGWYDPRTLARLNPSGSAAPISSQRVLLEAIDWP
ncbi:MAG: 6-pyruvoyl-tetrahydropterin synthase-related protein [Anaerolineae bacterium]